MSRSVFFENSFSSFMMDAVPLSSTAFHHLAGPISLNTLSLLFFMEAGKRYWFWDLSKSWIQIVQAEAKGVPLPSFHSDASSREI
jgi:hypothetical protein